MIQKTKATVQKLTLNLKNCGSSKHLEFTIRLTNTQDSQRLSIGSIEVNKRPQLSRAVFPNQGSARNL